MAIRLTNTSSTVRELYLRGREITFDLTVVDVKGNEIWRRLQDDPVPAILQIRTLGPGETLELKHRWNQLTREGGRVPDGAYTVRAEVLTDGSAALISNDTRLIVRSLASGDRRPRRR